MNTWTWSNLPTTTTGDANEYKIVLDLCPHYFYPIAMTIPNLINYLRYYSAVYDVSHAEVTVNGDSFDGDSLDYELEPTLPPEGTDRRMLNLNIKNRDND